MTALFRTFRLLFILGALGVATGTAWAVTRPFADGSYESIRKAHQGQPFALVFWSVDCSPCVKELSLLAAALKQHPQMKLVLVSTDESAYRARVEEMLVKHGLEHVESWMFGDDDSSRLRYQVDPRWYGELPRSYFYDAQHNRTALTGAMTAEHLDSWLKTARQ